MMQRDSWASKTSYSSQLYHSNDLSDSMCENLSGESINDTVKQLQLLFRYSLMTTSAEEDCGETLTWHLRPPKQGYDSNEGVGSVCVFVYWSSH